MHKKTVIFYINRMTKFAFLNNERVIGTKHFIDKLLITFIEEFSGSGHKVFTVNSILIANCYGRKADLQTNAGQ